MNTISYCLQRLVELRPNVNSLFKEMFSDSETAEREWGMLPTTGDPIQADLTQLAFMQQRLAYVKQINAMYFDVPIHIVGSRDIYTHYTTYRAARQAFPLAYQDYLAIMKTYMHGNTALQVEIGYNTVDGKQIFNIHFHIIAEKHSYTLFLKDTPQFRIGRLRRARWKLVTRRAKRETNGRYKGQTDTNYVHTQATYHSKLSVLQGDSRNCKRSVALDATDEIIQGQAELRRLFPPVARCPNPARKVALSFNEEYKRTSKLERKVTAVRLEMASLVKCLATLQANQRLQDKILKYRAKNAKPALSLHKLIQETVYRGVTALARCRPLGEELFYSS